MSIVFDASVVIGALDDKDHQHQAACLIMAQASGEPWLIAALTRTEIMAGYIARNEYEFGTSTLEQLGLLTVPALAGSPELDLVQRSEVWADLVADVRAKYRLKLPDAVVLATAKITSGTVATTDERLAKCAAAEDLLFAPNGP